MKMEIDLKIRFTEEDWRKVSEATIDRTAAKTRAYPTTLSADILTQKLVSNTYKRKREKVSLKTAQHIPSVLGYSRTLEARADIFITISCTNSLETFFPPSTTISYHTSKALVQKPCNS
jgi:hypothetical protein